MLIIAEGFALGNMPGSIPWPGRRGPTIGTFRIRLGSIGMLISIGGIRHERLSPADIFM
jgi:hypothetical protein